MIDLQLVVLQEMYSVFSPFSMCKTGMTDAESVYNYLIHSIRREIGQPKIVFFILLSLVF